MKHKPYDAPTRLLTWAIRRWKERDTMADHAQQQQQHSSQKKLGDGISKKIITLYARLIGDEQTVQLNKEEKELFAALLTKKYPRLSTIAELADEPAKLPFKARTKRWGDRLFYAACGVGVVFLLFLALTK